MDLSQIREILKIVAESGVAEVEIEEDDFKMVVRLNTPNVSIQSQAPAYPFPQPVYAPPPAYAQPPAAPVAPAPAPAAAAPAAPAAATPAPAADPANTIKAPIVGTFYRAPSPEADAFVKVGDTVQVGDVLCIIEAMKLMNEIESEVAGTIKEILIQDAEPVEYDQPLFVIEPA
ncbi:MAG: acetyl-CoA carboxylase biotin carboxyl carrier protein [Bacteroidota bacterium]